jgi:pimeloyl-ACP methyl ester carboxylesterase
MTPRNTIIEAGGKALEVRIWGEPGDHPTLVLLHEGLGSIDLWQTFPEALHRATDWPVVAYSRAGHGRSEAADVPRSLDWMTHEATEVLPEILASSGVGTSLLVGHSDGATIAALYAAYGRDRHDNCGLVLMAPHFFTEPVGLAEIARARDRFATSDLPQRMAKYHDDPIGLFDGWSGAWLDPAFATWNVEAALERIKVPVLAIQGRDDQYGTLAQISAVTAHVPGSVESLILENCKHAPHLEKPEEVVLAIEKMCIKMPK